jgi:hypothetical protein
MANVIFIGEKYIKDTSYIDENVDADLLTNCILETQDFRILPIVGTGLYDELKTQISGGSLTGLNTTLLNTYIAPALKYWVLHDGALILSYKIMNKSIVKRDSENSDNLGLDELDRLMDFFKNRAEFYSERITRYLVENETSYPLYNDAGDGFDTVHPKRNNYTQGLFLGETKVRKGLDIDYGRLEY